MGLAVPSRVPESLHEEQGVRRADFVRFVACWAAVADEATGSVADSAATWMVLEMEGKGGAQARRLEPLVSASPHGSKGRMGGGGGCSDGPLIPARQAARWRCGGEGVAGIGGQAACHKASPPPMTS